jgi:hypothetical protein
MRKLDADGAIGPAKHAQIVTVVTDQVRGYT